MASLVGQAKRSYEVFTTNVGFFRKVVEHKNSYTAPMRPNLEASAVR